MLKSLGKLLGPKSKVPQDERIQEPKDRKQELAEQFPDFDAATIDIIRTVEPMTMTSPERIESLCSAIRYLTESSLPGDIVECGVWRGGSMMAIAHTLLENDDSQRILHLYDTFEGMPPAREEDKDLNDSDANQLLDQQDINDPHSIWCFSGLDEVKQNMHSTGYPSDQIHYIKGKVEDTLKNELPGSIALLRLDTDWYESTRVCLESLYPRLQDGGILIIDDYGHWKGCRQAVDEYFERHHIPILLQRIDYTGRIAIKPQASPAKQSA